MKKLLTPLFASIIALCVVSPCEGKVFRHLDCKSEGTVFVADSIDCRKDLTRLYGRLTGRPHTSERIDSVTIKINGKIYVSNDIDGVDFKRWFQWEDEGEIPVEIDFPTLKLGKTATVEAFGPRGNSLWTLTVE